MKNDHCQFLFHFWGHKGDVEFSFDCKDKQQPGERYCTKHYLFTIELCAKLKDMGHAFPED